MMPSGTTAFVRVGTSAVASSAAVEGSLESLQPLDPVLEFLLRNVRSKAVRKHFARVPTKEYTQKRAVKILVGA